MATKIKEKLTPEQIEREMLYRTWFPEDVTLDDRDVIPDDETDRLLEAFQKFCREAVTIKVPGARIPFELRDAQLDTVRAWIQHRYNICLKARQIGFSTLAAAFCLWVAIAAPDRQIYMLSRRQDDSVSLLNKVKFAWKSLPEWVRDRSPSVLDKTTLRMTFDNDSFIESSPTGSDPIRGETAFLVIVDEWAFFQNEEEAWASIEPVTDVGGRVVGLSTANGEGRFYHRLWVGAETGNNSFNPVFHPWWAVPERDEAWYENKKRNMEPWQLYQEYPSNAEEAFIGSGNPFFNLDVLREKQISDPIQTSVIQATGRLKYEEYADGDFLIYKAPMEDERYVVGADVALGLDHGDWSVAYVLAASNGELVAMYRGKIDPDYFAAILAGIGIKYNVAMLIPEVNNAGRTTLDHLRRLKYPRIYSRFTKTKHSISSTETIGWLTTHGNKQEMLHELGVWLRDHNVPHAHTLAELKTFVREQKGDSIKLHGSPHDDCVMALAIAVQGLQFAHSQPFKMTAPENTPGSIAWWANKLDGGRKGGRRRASPVFS